MSLRLSLIECPHGTRAISLDNEWGGLRLFGDKCCGRWSVVNEWPVTASELREAANELECWADSADDSAPPESGDARAPEEAE